MEFLRGTITYGEKVVLKNVDLWLTCAGDASTGSANWAGLFHWHGGPALSGGRRYRLVLSDGRAGAIRISGTRSVAMDFVGAGPLAQASRRGDGG